MPSLEQLPGPDRASTVAALETATSFAAWDNLRVEQRLSVARARAAVMATVDALLQRAP